MFTLFLALQVLNEKDILPWLGHVLYKTTHLGSLNCIIKLKLYDKTFTMQYNAKLNQLFGKLYFLKSEFQCNTVLWNCKNKTFWKCCGGKSPQFQMDSLVK